MNCSLTIVVSKEMLRNQEVRGAAIHGACWVFTTHPDSPPETWPPRNAPESPRLFDEGSSQNMATQLVQICEPSSNWSMNRQG